MFFLKKTNRILKTAFFLPDVLILIFILLIINGLIKSSFSAKYFIYFVLLMLTVKILIQIADYKFVLAKRISATRKIISNFKQGKFSIQNYNFPRDGYITDVISDLKDAGRYFENLVESQQDEIEKFKELYNNVVLSSSSYILIVNSKNEIIFSNKSFTSKFQYPTNDLAGRDINDVFYISAGVFGDALETVKTSGESTVIRQINIMAKNKISIIADIKISKIIVQGDIQLIIIIDDVTSKYRKDYHLSLISQFSASVEYDAEIGQLFFAILTAITSGSGLGFNRAMLFLFDDDTQILHGAMAVGPDSYEEAVQIWGAVQSEGVNINEIMKTYGNKEQKGHALYEKVTNSSYKLSDNNLMVRAFRENKSYHIYNAYNDSNVDDMTREFIGSNEFVIIPLIAVNKVIGIIIVDNKFNNNPIWNDHVELLSTFAAQSAISIENYRNLSNLKLQMDSMQSRQNAIVESEKMAAVGRIAAHIAHEIRNPLSTMGGYARRIIKQCSRGDKNTGSIEKSAIVIQHEVERLEKLLSNVMDFTKPSKIIKEYNNLNEVINDTVMLLNNVLQERKIKITKDLMPDIPLVKSDFNALKQVLLNLLQNSMDVVPAGGNIKVKTFIENSKLFIRILDDGPGVTQDNMKRLFEPFFTTKVTGVGLGLATVKKIINDHDGDIYAKNRQEGGTEFTIELPIPS